MRPAAMESWNGITEQSKGLQREELGDNLVIGTIVRMRAYGIVSQSFQSFYRVRSYFIRRPLTVIYLCYPIWNDFWKFRSRVEGEFPSSEYN